MGARAALVVAAHEFVDPKFQQLRSPSRDVDALAEVLGDQAVGAFEVETLVNVASGEVQRTLERFFSARKPDDLLLLYFSCHGVKDAAGRLYFVTSNTEFSFLRSTGISASFVSEQMEYSMSKRIVVLLDCCYSGAFLKGFRARGDDAVAVEQLEGRGRAVITASRATEYAFEADQLSSENAQPSLFTGAIVEGLASGRADANGDGKVTVDELYDYVYDAVRGKVAGQTPGRWIDVEGDLVVARNPSPPVAAAPLPPEVLRAVESDMAMQRLGAAYELTTWYQSPDEARQKAAAPVLERLRRDYDERVKAVAAATLAAPPGPPLPGAEPPKPVPPKPMPAEPMPTEMVPPKPSPPPRPAAATPAPSSAVPASPPTASPEGHRSPPHQALATAASRDRASSAAAWLAGLGGVALLVSPYPTYMAYSDYSATLNARGWHSLGSFLLFGVALAAASWLLRTQRPPAVALAALVGLLPFAAGSSVLEMAMAVKEGSDGASPGTGWYLMQVGFALWIFAGLVAAQRLRRQVTIAPRRSGPGARSAPSAIAIIAILIGMGASFGWASLLGLVDLGSYGPVHSLILRTGVVVLALALGWRWIRQRSFEGRALGSASLLLTLLVASYLLNGSVRGGDDWILEIALAILVISSMVIPVFAAALEPRLAAVGLLGAWTAATAAWIPAWLLREYDAGLLAVATVAVALLTAVLARPMRVGDHASERLART